MPRMCTPLNPTTQIQSAYPSQSSPTRRRNLSFSSLDSKPFLLPLQWLHQGLQLITYRVDKAPLLLLASLFLFSCGKTKLVGQVFTANSATTIDLKSSEGEIKLVNGARVEINLGSTMPWQPVQLKLKSDFGDFKTEISSVKLEDDKSFFLTKEVSGQAYDIHGYPAQFLAKEWDEDGVDNCVLPGDCGGYVIAVNPYGQTGYVWQSRVCAGKQNVVWHRKLTISGYRVDFGKAGYFLADPKQNIDDQVKQIKSQCSR